MPSQTRTPEVTNLLIVGGVATSLPPISMEGAGWRERADIQRWVRANPDLVETDLLLISEEFADWEGAAVRVRDRLDLLFLDADGRPLVVELKRGAAPERTESQALLYAAYSDQLSTTDLVEQYSKTHGVDLEEARDLVTAHAPALADDQPGRVRVRIVAENFPPSVTATVLFLREIGSGGPEASRLDIGCVKLTAYKLPDGAHIVSAQPIIPIPETEAYQVRRRRRIADDESSRQERTRVANAVPTLQREGSIPAGTLLTPNLAWYSNREREAVEAWLDSEPAWATIAWTGELSARRAVLQGEIDEPISLGAAHEAFRSAAGLRSAPDATSAWLVGDTGKSVRQLADECIAAGSGDSANAEAVGSLQSSSSIDLG